MQHPVGYVIDPATGRPMLNDFFALVTNPKGWLFFGHTITVGLATASFLILGVSAYHIVRKSNVEFFKRSFQMPPSSGWSPRCWLLLTGIHRASMSTRPSP